MLRWLRSLLPREERFVDHFSAHTERMVAAADALVAMMEADEKDREDRFRDVCTIEGEADAITRTTIVALHRTFITPFDRSDIHALITALDDAVDFIEEVAQHAILYQVKEFTPRMREMAAIIQTGARLLAEAMPLLSNISGNSERITSLCERVSRLESDADKVLRLALSELIAERPDTISFLGRKEVYELLETVTDRCDDVGDVIAGIVFDHV
jgi:predicted phosphate transport protein (TIGR00153 family)